MNCEPQRMQKWLDMVVRGRSMISRLSGVLGAVFIPTIGGSGVVFERVRHEK